MTLPPHASGPIRSVWTAPTTIRPWSAISQQRRRLDVAQRRSYYEGQQYAADNLKTSDELADAGWTETFLPEHQRKHHYADVLGDGIDFLADQISGGQILRSADTDDETGAETDEQKRVTAWISQLLQRSGMENREQETVKEILIAGDLLAHIVADPEADAELGEPAVRIDLWEGETFEIDYDPFDWQSMIEVRLETTEERAVDDEIRVFVILRRFRLLPQLQVDGTFENELTEEVYEYDAMIVGDIYTVEPIRTIRWGIPIFPFVHLHGEYEQMRSMWGKSVITELVMQTADRMNATSQVEFLAVRYNATAKLAITGDWAAMNLDDATIPTDIADVLTLPFANDIKELFLRTDVGLILQHKDQVIDSLYRLIGLQRLDGTKIAAFGQVSGYALEILNRQTDGTFRRIVGNLTTGYVEMIQMSFLVDAYTRGRVIVEDFETIDTLTELATLYGVDSAPLFEWHMNEAGVFPSGQTFEQYWPNTNLYVDFGSAYIVDEMAVRDDYVAGIISRREALRKLRYTDADIDRIEKEIEEEDDGTADSLDAALRAGSRLDLDRE